MIPIEAQTYAEHVIPGAHKMSQILKPGYKSIIKRLFNSLVPGLPGNFFHQAEIAAHLIQSLDDKTPLKTLSIDGEEDLTHIQRQFARDLSNSPFISPLYCRQRKKYFRENMRNKIKYPDWIQDPITRTGFSSKEKRKAFYDFYSEYFKKNSKDCIYRFRQRRPFSFNKHTLPELIVGPTQQTNGPASFKFYIYNTDNQLEDPDKLTSFYESLKEASLHPNSIKLHIEDQVVHYYFILNREEIAQIKKISEDHRIVMRGPAQDDYMLKDDFCYKGSFVSMIPEDSYDSSFREGPFWTEIEYDPLVFFEKYLIAMFRANKKPCAPLERSVIYASPKRFITDNFLRTRFSLEDYLTKQFSGLLYQYLSHPLIAGSWDKEDTKGIEITLVRDTTKSLRNPFNIEQLKQNSLGRFFYENNGFFPFANYYNKI